MQNEIYSIGNVWDTTKRRYKLLPKLCMTWNQWTINKSKWLMNPAFYDYNGRRSILKYGACCYVKPWFKYTGKSVGC